VGLGQILTGRKITHMPEFDPLTVQPLRRRYADYSVPDDNKVCNKLNGVM